MYRRKGEGRKKREIHWEGEVLTVSKSERDDGGGEKFQILTKGGERASVRVEPVEEMHSRGGEH